VSAGCGASVHGIGALDRLSRGTSPIHTLDPRAKLAVTLAFAIAVASVPKYALDTLLPFAVFPLFMLIRSEIPASFVLRRLAVLAPFAVVAGAFNPLLDTHTVLRIGGVGISGGWLSFASILVRFALTIGALIVLAASTGVPALGHAAKKLGAPLALVTQILGLYRYLFLTLEESQRTLLAWRLRNPRGRHPSWRVFAQILGQLLLRSAARAGRVHDAMLCRGFDGEVRMLTPLSARRRDWAFTLGWIAAFAALRFASPAEAIGTVLGRLT
jgi:cobalt/nickel transport system permease protein